MEHFSLEELRQSKNFIDNIRWDITPKIFFQPRLPVSGVKAVNIEGNMFYVDIVYNRPTVVIMKNTSSMSKTVGYLEDVPAELLKEAMNCSVEECISGMYPITRKLEEWLKKELGLP